MKGPPSKWGLPADPDRQTHLKTGARRWYMPRPNDGATFPASRDEIQHRFGHYYYYND